MKGAILNRREDLLRMRLWEQMFALGQHAGWRPWSAQGYAREVPIELRAGAAGLAWHAAETQETGAEWFPAPVWWPWLGPWQLVATLAGEETGRGAGAVLQLQRQEDDLAAVVWQGWLASSGGDAASCEMAILPMALDAVGALPRMMACFGMLA